MQMGFKKWPFFYPLVILKGLSLLLSPLPPRWTLNPFIRGDSRRRIWVFFPSPLASLAFLLFVWMLLFMAPCQHTDVNYCLIIKRKKPKHREAHTPSVLMTIELSTYSQDRVVWRQWWAIHLHCSRNFGFLQSFIKNDSRQTQPAGKLCPWGFDGQPSALSATPASSKVTFLVPSTPSSCHLPQSSGHREPHVRCLLPSVKQV